MRPGLRPQDRIVPLQPGEALQCALIGAQRFRAGTPSRAPDSGVDPLRVDIVGAMAEWAVCLWYGLSPKDWVVVHEQRPGPIPDLVYRGFPVSVKGRERWESPLDLVVGEHDTTNAIFILVSVDWDTAVCGLRGWIGRRDLETYPLREWQWTDDRPGARKPGKRRRYVPVEDLKPCASVGSADHGSGASTAIVETR